VLVAGPAWMLEADNRNTIIDQNHRLNFVSSVVGANGSRLE
jgi:hypothetical protein